MFEFEIPTEDLSLCDEIALTINLQIARDEFEALNLSDDLSDDCINRMSDLATFIAEASQEAIARVELAAYKRKSMAKKMKKMRFASFTNLFATNEKEYKTENGVEYPASDFAYVPDPSAPSSWKLRLTSTPGGDPDARIVGAAIAALGEGFRGNKVEIPSEDLDAVKAKVRSAWKHIHGNDEEVPAVIACGMHGDEDHVMYEEEFNLQAHDDDDAILYELSDHHEAILNMLENYTAVSPEVQAFIDATISAIGDAEDKIDTLVKNEDDYSDEEDDYEDEDEDEPMQADHGGGMSHYSDDTVTLDADTEEFASCAASSKRVAKARRSLRKAIRAYRSCTGTYRVRHVPFPPPPPEPPGPPPPPPPPPPMP